MLTLSPTKRRAQPRGRVRIQAPLPDRYSTATDAEIADMIEASKRVLGDRLLILGHHYQRPEVIRWADVRGDSFGLSRQAADRDDAEYIVFCGVHFMAESADILTGDHQAVILPDLNAGCSMADMADIDEVEAAWDELGSVIDTSRVVPITYMNSSAALKAFVGRHGGAVCTSSNARAVLTWALAGGATAHAGDGWPFQILFFPDQHLGRNTGFQLGYSAADMAVWDPKRDMGGLDPAALTSLTLILWKRHCSVHQRFTTDHVRTAREQYPGATVVVHPECDHAVVELADLVGSTEFILKTVQAAPAGSTLVIGTEIHMVQRLAAEHPDLTVVSLDPLVCPCSTMFRIDGPHLAWCLEELAAGRIVNQITVDPDTTRWARVALDRMLSIV